MVSVETFCAFWSETTVCVTHCREEGFQIREEHFLAEQRSRKPPYFVAGMAFPYSGWWVQASSKQSEGKSTLSKCKSLPLSNEHWTSGWPFCICWSSRKVNETLAVMEILYLFTLPEPFLILGLKKLQPSLWCFMHYLVLASRYVTFSRFYCFYQSDSIPWKAPSVPPVCFSSSQRVDKNCIFVLALAPPLISGVTFGLGLCSRCFWQ